jgi:hypothetical protein
VTYSGAAAGFGNSTANVTLQRAGIVIQGPGSLGNPILASTKDGPQTVTVSTAILDAGGNVVDLQPLAGGGSISIGVVSSNTNVGTITSSPVTITGGSGSASTAFQPIAQGSATVTPIQPSGFVTPAQFGSVSASVFQAQLGLTDNVAVGMGLQSSLSVFIGTLAPPGGLAVTLTSNNPATLRLSASATAAGQTAITVTIPAGQNSAVYYLQSLAGSGFATYTASANGYPIRTATVPFSPSGIVVLGPGGVPFFSTSLSAGTTSPISAAAARLDPSTNAFVETQQLAGGTSLSINLGVSPPGLGSVVSPVTLTGGTDSAASQFRPLATGQAAISATQPPNFTTPTSFNSVAVFINP